MLGPVQIEIGKAVNAGMGQEFCRLRAFNGQLIHVMGLIKQHRAMPPGCLFRAPVAEFRGHHRVDIHTYLRITSISTGFLWPAMTEVRFGTVMFQVLFQVFRSSC